MEDEEAWDDVPIEPGEVASASGTGGEEAWDDGLTLGAAAPAAAVAPENTEEGELLLNLDEVPEFMRDGTGDSGTGEGGDGLQGGPSRARPRLPHEVAYCVAIQRAQVVGQLAFLVRAAWLASNAALSRDAAVHFFGAGTGASAAVVPSLEALTVQLHAARSALCLVGSLSSPVYRDRPNAPLEPWAPPPAASSSSSSSRRRKGRGSDERRSSGDGRAEQPLALSRRGLTQLLTAAEAAGGGAVLTSCPAAAVTLVGAALRGLGYSVRLVRACLHAAAPQVYAAVEAAADAATAAAAEGVEGDGAAAAPPPAKRRRVEGNGGSGSVAGSPQAELAVEDSSNSETAPSHGRVSLSTVKRKSKAAAAAAASFVEGAVLLEGVAGVPGSATKASSSTPESVGMEELTAEKLRKAAGPLLWLEVLCCAPPLAGTAAAAAAAPASSSTAPAATRWVAVDPLRLWIDVPAAYETHLLPRACPLTAVVAVDIASGAATDVTRRYTLRWSEAERLRGLAGMGADAALADGYAAVKAAVAVRAAAKRTATKAAKRAGIAAGKSGSSASGGLAAMVAATEAAAVAASAGAVERARVAAFLAAAGAASGSGSIDKAAGGGSGGGSAESAGAVVSLVPVLPPRCLLPAGPGNPMRPPPEEGEGWVPYALRVAAAVGARRRKRGAEAPSAAAAAPSASASGVVDLTEEDDGVLVLEGGAVSSFSSSSSVAAPPAPPPAPALDEDTELAVAQAEEAMPTSITAFARHPRYVLTRHLKQDEAVAPGTLPVGFFKGEKVWPRAAVAQLLTRSQWVRRHGRIVTPAAVRAPVRRLPLSASTGRGSSARVDYTGGGGGSGSRSSGGSASDPYLFAALEAPEAFDAAADGGSSGGAAASSTSDAGGLGIPLYGIWQTAPFTPPPYTGGPLPRNDKGNFPVWNGNVALVPAGLVYVSDADAYKPKKAAVKLSLDHVEVITGFEHRGGRAFPVLDGVLVRAADASLLREACDDVAAGLAKKAEDKRLAAVLGRWETLVKGVLNMLRIRSTYYAEEGGEGGGGGAGEGSSGLSAARRSSPSR